MKHLFEPIWTVEILLILFSVCTFLIGCYAKNAFVALFFTGLTTLLSGWFGHSMNHNRNPLCYKLGLIYGPIIGGFSPRWWNRKHNLHHMFTNHMKKDEDIQHSYNRWLFPFLYLKWKIDAIVTDWNKFEVIYLIIHWYFYF